MEPFRKLIPFGSVTRPQEKFYKEALHQLKDIKNKTIKIVKKTRPSEMTWKNIGESILRYESSSLILYKELSSE